MDEDNGTTFSVGERPVTQRQWRLVASSRDFTQYPMRCDKRVYGVPHVRDFHQGIGSKI